MEPLGDGVDDEPRPGCARELYQEPVGVAVAAGHDGVILLAVVPRPELGGVHALAREFF